MPSSNGNNTWLFLLADLGLGGSEKKTIKIVNNLHKRGHNVHLAYLKTQEDLLPMISSDIPVISLCRESRMDMAAIKRLRAYLCDNNVDVVWCVNLYPLLYAFFALLRDRKNCRIYCSINTTYFNNLYTRLQMIVYAPLLHLCDHIIFGCQYQMEHWKKTYLLPESMSSVIYNGVDLTYFDPALFLMGQDEIRGKYNIKSEQLVLGNVAMLRPEKGHLYLLQVVKKLLDDGVDVMLMLVGDGAEYGRLNRFVSENLLEENVVFLGQLSDIRPILSIVDIFILPSTAVETFSNAVLEAMAMECPVIMSNLSGAAEMIEHERSGYLFEPGNVLQLYGGIKKLINTEYRLNLARTGRQKASEMFAVNRMVDDYESILRSS